MAGGTSWGRVAGAICTWLRTEEVVEVPNLGGADTFAKWLALREDCFALEDGLLYFVETVREGAVYSSRFRLAVPAEKKAEVMQMYHEHPMEGGHASIRRAYAKLRRYAWWPRMYSDLREYIRGCLVCQVAGKC